MPARLALGAGAAEPGLQYYRRAHDDQGRLRMVSLTEFPTPPEDLRYDAVDRQVGVLRVDREGRRPAALVAFGCHALALWDQRGNISGDYPGRMSRDLAAAGIDSLFFQGALGNVHPVRRERDPAGRIGRSLAATVRQVWSGPGDWTRRPGAGLRHRGAGAGGHRRGGGREGGVGGPALGGGRPGRGTTTGGTRHFASGRRRSR